ncbi:MAG: hypothetical protein ABSE25_08715 [Syntrophorhabdales bacterium]|jgi:hypothetical protein
MLDEKEVTEAVSLYLSERGYTVPEKSIADPRGVDVVVYHPDTRSKIFISAAGVARSEAGRGKLEASYTESQVLRCVARGIYSAFKMPVPDHFIPGDKIAIAFPDIPAFHKYLNAQKPVMDSLGIKAFLVAGDSKVTEL